MTDPLRLAVTLPARSLHEAKGEVQVARAAGADFAEIRFDRWPPREWPDAVGLFPTPLPLIATLRSGTEGGEGPDDPVERARWFSIVGELPFAFLDVELARDLADVPHHRSTTVLSSCHLSPGASIAEIGHLAERADRVGSWRKLVVPASVGTFLRDILPNLPRWLDPRTIVLTTGPSGSLARIWARELGEPMVFAALPLAAPSAAPVEPTQVPVDQLARMRSGGRGRRFAVVGAPVGHSLSPAVHGLWLARQQRAASYVALPLDGEAEVRAMLSLGRRGWWDGWSVTHPWKTRLAQEADVRSEAVARTGAASALVFRDGQARAEQTDAEAVRRRARELEEAGRWDGREALVVGTGGAARAAVFALEPSRRQVWVVGRRTEATESLVRALGGTVPPRATEHPVGLVLQATTVGRANSGPLVPPLGEWIDRETTVVDFVYGGTDPSIARLARERGSTYEDGRRLLVYQAAAAHALWWGEPPAEELLEAALSRVNCAA